MYTNENTHKSSQNKMHIPVYIDSQPLEHRRARIHTHTF